MQNIIVDEGPTSDYSTATEIPWNNKSIRLEYTLLRVVQTIGAHVADHKDHDMMWLRVYNTFRTQPVINEYKLQLMNI